MNTTYDEMYSEELHEQVKENYTIVDTFTSYGNVICEIYQRNL